MFVTTFSWTKLGQTPHPPKNDEMAKWTTRQSECISLFYSKKVMDFIDPGNPTSRDILFLW